jgi:hypothetical protein
MPTAAGNVFGITADGFLRVDARVDLAEALVSVDSSIDVSDICR